MATKKIPKVFEAAADAAIEIGEAAREAKKSWEHVKKAQAKAKPATRVAAKAGKKVLKRVKGAVSKKKRK